ncbi:MAG: hypothetical protein KF688_06105 [Pirellulales bacterium]|nr:hypothetical protein [Pirellulales bacterium]
MDADPCLLTIDAEPEPSDGGGQSVAWGVGPWHAREFGVLTTVLGDQAPSPVLDTLSAAIERIDGNPNPPEVVLLAQPRPGYFAEHEAAALVRAAPLTRVVVVAGTWCEGEWRTGRPLAGLPRLYWYEFAAWWRRALADRHGGRQPAWADPLVDPRWPAWRSRLAGANGTRNGEYKTAANRVAIDVGDYESFIALQLALKPHGWRCVWQPRHRPEVWNTHRTGGASDAAPVAGIWDGGQLDDVETAALTAFAGRLAPRAAPVVALLDFPRAEHHAAVRAAGACAVLGKPYCVDALAEELARAVGQRNLA